jgi:hypothetical protein
MSAVARIFIEPQFPAHRRRNNWLTISSTGPFGGAATELVLHALAGGKSSPAELDEIRRLLDQLERSTSNHCKKK